MSCKHPLIRNKATGKFVNASLDEAWRNPGYQLIPCGKCIACRLAKSRTWADRNMLEAKYYPEDEVWFLTLTYSPEEVPTAIISETELKEDGSLERMMYRGGTNIIEDGELVTAQTLYPRDLELFWKRLRKNTGQKVRYFACGEYGSTTNRPHYHAIVYGLKLDDLELIGHNQNHQPLYTSKTVEEIWGHGIICIAHNNWETAAYVSRYIMKKQYGKGAIEDYNARGQLPEFTRMSRNPGIGRQYYEDHKYEIYQNDELFLSQGKGKVNRIKPPRYYDKLFDIEEQRELLSDSLEYKNLEEIKTARQEKARAFTELKMSQSTLTMSEQLKREENADKRHARQLKRTLE